MSIFGDFLVWYWSFQKMITIAPILILLGQNRACKLDFGKDSMSVKFCKFFAKFFKK